MSSQQCRYRNLIQIAYRLLRLVVVILPVHFECGDYILEDHVLEAPINLHFTDAHLVNSNGSQLRLILRLISSACQCTLCLQVGLDMEACPLAVQAPVPCLALRFTGQNQLQPSNPTEEL